MTSTASPRESAAIRRNAERVAAIKAEVAGTSPPDADQLYAAYCEAARTAQRTLAFADCDAAGRAWAAFLNAYAPVPSVAAAVLPKPIGGRG